MFKDKKQYFAAYFPVIIEHIRTGESKTGMYESTVSTGWLWILSIVSGKLSILIQGHPVEIISGII
jgi:hypothetical protein